MVTIQFVPYVEIEHDDSAHRIEKMLGIAKEDKIVVLQGRLRPQEESELIRRTMELIDDNFKGIELAVIDGNDTEGQQFFAKLKTRLIKFLIGDRGSMTIIGPAVVVKEIKKDPNKIQLMLEDHKGKKKKGKR